ncbi:hypothetical protein PAAG_05539 [Paracoccidioides lutzii Pb01]|uniref:Metallo-beta-lactamase domain-containing protein n=1 Tax=Paracoccidioides lutzii (strain ATCC MYA-826 / Pb01) TaxID=502779 RepID=C1H446_PARBA|nr:hypothetical protein PAAG_05539 [Paracoccidioides lutzii Pb01]EEH34490.2 hypothetical protein PAAG_05539 [Paracoccidioides lutzii Pb01]
MSLNVMVTHALTDGHKMIFDLGLREDAENYIPPVAERIRAPEIINVKEGVFDSLEKANIDPKTDIDMLPSSGKSQTWQVLGSLPAAMDYFGDGSVFIIDAPGHLAGHFNLLVRIDSEKWMCLAGDTAHDVRVYKGTRELAVFPDPNQPGCVI